MEVQEHVRKSKGTWSPSLWEILFGPSAYTEYTALTRGDSQASLKKYFTLFFQDSIECFSSMVDFKVEILSVWVLDPGTSWIRRIEVG